jgi:hypothetical protein
MSNDQEVVDVAYEAAVQKLYSVMLAAYVNDSTTSGRKQADERFKAGVELARAVRDRAKQLV